MRLVESQIDTHIKMLNPTSKSVIYTQLYQRYSRLIRFKF